MLSMTLLLTVCYGQVIKHLLNTISIYYPDESKAIYGIFCRKLQCSLYVEIYTGGVLSFETWELLSIGGLPHKTLFQFMNIEIRIGMLSVDRCSYGQHDQNLSLSVLVAPFDSFIIVVHMCTCYFELNALPTKKKLFTFSNWFSDIRLTRIQCSYFICSDCLQRTRVERLNGRKLSRWSDDLILKIRFADDKMSFFPCDEAQSFSWFLFLTYINKNHKFYSFFPLPPSLCSTFSQTRKNTDKSCFHFILCILYYCIQKQFGNNASGSKAEMWVKCSDRQNEEIFN